MIESIGEIKEVEESIDKALSVLNRPVGDIATGEESVQGGLVWGSVW